MLKKRITEIAAKKLYASVAVPPVPVRIPSQWLFALGITSVTPVD